MPLSGVIDEFLKKHPEWEDCMDLVIMPPTLDEVLEEFPDVEWLEDDQPTSFGVTAYALYVKTRRGGTSHKFAKMVAWQSGPALQTDSTFFKGMPALGDQFADERQKNNVIRRAMRNGYNPVAGDVYQSGLARFQGDPEAFVPRSGGRGYIKKLCEQRGWQCEGAVEVPYREPESDPWEKSTPLAEDLVQRNMKDALQKNPDLAGLDRRELRKKIIRKHGPSDGTD